MYIYLAGTISHYYKTGKPELATGWRNKIIYWAKGNNIKYFNPCHNYNYGTDYEIFDEYSCIYQNKFYLKKSTMMIVNLNDIKESYGTQWEIALAKELYDIPIIAIGEKNWSPHLNYNISQFCKDEDEVIKFIMGMYL